MKYTPKYIKGFEIVPNDIYAIHFENSLYYIDDRILFTLDRVREYFNAPITINNWKNWTPAMGQKFEQRGFRNDIGTGAKYSPHRYGRAVDFDIKGVTSEEFRQLVKSGKLDDQLKYINRIEDKVNWIHMDCIGVYRDKDEKIYFFNP